MSPKYASLLEYGGRFEGAYILRRALYMPWELERFMDPAVFREGWETLGLQRRMAASFDRVRGSHQRVAALEMAWYLRNQLLRDADWAGMAHSLEIRVPMVDATLLCRLAPLLVSSHAPTKLDAARTPARRLPDQVLMRPKTGFSIPVHKWTHSAKFAFSQQRQLRNWAHAVYRPYKKLRALVLLSDAFGGHGGIALYNRDLLTAMCSMNEIEEIVALPRLISREMEALPRKLTYRRNFANSKWRYILGALALLWSDTRYDLVVCSHLNLLPISALAKLRLDAPLVTLLYGIEAWSPQPRWRRALLDRVDHFVSISEVTRRKFIAWSNVREERITILPNAIHTERYGGGGPNPTLVERYALAGKTVLMTVGRLVSSERYKGFDEVIEALPSLLQEMPQLVYLVVGDGSDRARLEAKVAQLGLREHVRFTGMIPEAEKSDHYRVADAYVMPSRGEGFGFVFLEALACGIPTVGSAVDGGREALREGELGILVNPADRDDVKRGIREALRRGRGAPPPGLEFFAFDNFRARTAQMIVKSLHPQQGPRRAT